MIFNFKSWEYLFPQPWLGKNEWLILVDGKKKENRMDVCSSFERIEMGKDNDGNLKFFKKIINPLEFGNTISYWFNYRS